VPRDLADRAARVAEPPSTTRNDASVRLALEGAESRGRERLLAERADAARRAGRRSHRPAASTPPALLTEEQTAERRVAWNLDPMIAADADADAHGHPVRTRDHHHLGRISEAPARLCDPEDPRLEVRAAWAAGRRPRIPVCNRTTILVREGGAAVRASS
jgi:hypothetical protein